MPPEPAKQKNKVFIVDDHPLVREWLSALVNQQADLIICGEAGNAADALKLIATAKPQIAVVDISLEGGSGLELIRNIKTVCPEVVVIVLSMHDEMIYSERALRAGARGYIMKRAATRNVLQAIRCVLAGKIYLADKVANMLARKAVQDEPFAPGFPADLISNRELEVFKLLGRGLNTRQIADELHVSVNTVQSFCARIKQKLKLAGANELLCEAVRWHDRQELK